MLTNVLLRHKGSVEETGKERPVSVEPRNQQRAALPVDVRISVFFKFILWALFKELLH